MFECSASHAASIVLVSGLKNILPSITPTRILTLNFDCQEDLAFPLTWAVSHFLSSLWQLRVAKKTIQLIKIRSDMEASRRLLRESRLAKTSEVLKIIFPDLLN